MSIVVWVLVPMSERLVCERLVIWVMFVRVMLLSTSASETTLETATRLDAVSVSETMGSVTESAGKDTVPAVTVRPFEERIAPTTSNAAPGEVVPMPTLPALFMVITTVPEVGVSKVKSLLDCNLTLLPFD